jgi:hypothetical protein
LYELIGRTGGFLVGMAPQRVGSTISGSYDYDDRVKAAIRISTRVIEAEIGNYYVLGVRPVNPDSKPAEWKIEAMDVQRHKRKDLRMAYPSRLPGCANLQTGSR